MGLSRTWLARTRLAASTLSAVLLTLPLASGATAQQLACGKAEFENVVQTVAVSLRDLNAKNRPAFQDKLRTLREKMGWSTDQFLAEAAVYVQDERIEEMDNRSSDLLAKLTSMGEAGANATGTDCKLLESLTATMKALVDTQTAKWAYMFGKIDKTLGQ